MKGMHVWIQRDYVSEWKLKETGDQIDVLSGSWQEQNMKQETL